MSNIYHEARGEPFKGKIAVALVTINRTKSERFPTTLCGVVKQRGQFSWVEKKLKVSDYAKWNESLLAANLALENNNILGNFDALYFHNLSVAPAWGRKFIARIGNHKFFA